MLRCREVDSSESATSLMTAGDSRWLVGELVLLRPLVNG
jgi:hypothetical protein